MSLRRIRAKINDEFTRVAAKHIRNKDLKDYREDGEYIYKMVTEEELANMVLNNGVGMEELGIDAEIDNTYKHEEK